MSELTVTEENSGHEVGVRRGDEIHLNLKENPSTGYQWELTLHTAGVLELADSRFAAVESVGIGGGGKRIFVFRAAAQGRETLVLELRRSWEVEVSPVALFELLVAVQ